LRPDRASRPHTALPARAQGPTADPRPGPPPYPVPNLASFPDPNAPPGSSARVFLDPVAFDALILAAVARFTDEVRDEGDLRQYRDAIARRGERAKASLGEQASRLHLGPTPTTDQVTEAL